MLRSTRSHTTVADLRAILADLPDSTPVEVQYPEGDWPGAVPTVARPEVVYDKTDGVLVIDAAEEV